MACKKLGKNLWHDSEFHESVEPNQSQLEWNVMFESHDDVVTCIDWTSFDFWYCFSNLHWKLCCWPTIHYSMPKICPKFQVLSSYFSDSKLWGQWAARCALSQKCGKRIFQLHSMSNVMMCIDQRFSAKNSGISFLVLIYWYSTWTIWEWQSRTLKIGSKLQDVTCHWLFFSVDQSMAEWVRWLWLSEAQ